MKADRIAKMAPHPEEMRLAVQVTRHARFLKIVLFCNYVGVRNNLKQFI